MFSEAAMSRPEHEIELELFERSREMNRKMLEAHMRARGQGDVGQAVEVIDDNGAVVHAHRRVQERHESTLFGEIGIERLAYRHPGKESIRPLDEQAQLPARSFSYAVQSLLARRAAQGPFDEAIDAVKEFTGRPVSKRSAEDLACDAATDFDAFYAQRTLKPPLETAAIVVGTVDGKGVPRARARAAPRRE